MAHVPLRLVAAGLVLIAALAACGGDDTREAPTFAPTSPAERIDAALAAGADVFAAQCLVCHTVNGQPGTGPVLDPDMLEVFPACKDEIEFTTIGSMDWPDDTYGATNKPIMGTGIAMPGFGTVLTPEELEAVALWSRVTLGGAELEPTADDCGILSD